MDGTLNALANPAARGSRVTLYATGLGLTEPPQDPGLIATSDQVRPIAPVSIGIGGQPAPVLSVGSMPGFVNGVFYIFVQVPEDLESGLVRVQLLSPFRDRGWTLAVR